VRSSIRARQRLADHAFDETQGYARLESGGPRVAYMFNMLPTELTGDDGVD
jgi:hypothetical protein